MIRVVMWLLLSLGLRPLINTLQDHVRYTCPVTSSNEQIHFGNPYFIPSPAWISSDYNRIPYQLIHCRARICIVVRGLQKYCLRPHRVSSTMSSSVFEIKEHTLECQHIREYARATAHSQEEVLYLTIKQYTPLDRQKPQDRDITIIGTHANGFPKVLISRNLVYISV